MKTTSQSKEVMERLSRFIQAGLACKYRSIEEAVIAFDNEVIKLVQTAVELGLKPGMNLSVKDWQQLVAGNKKQFQRSAQTAIIGQNLASVWQIPVALFFTEQIRFVRKKVEQVSSCLQMFEKNNGRILKLMDEMRSEVGNIKSAIDYFQMTNPQTLSVANEIRYVYILNRSHKTLAVAEEKQRLMSLLPFCEDEKKWAQMDFFTDESVDYQWVNSHIMATVLSRTDLFMKEKLVRKGVKALRQQGWKKVADKVWKKWLRRSFSPQGEDRKKLRQFLDQAVQFVLGNTEAVLKSAKEKKIPVDVALLMSPFLVKDYLDIGPVIEEEED